MSEISLYFENTKYTCSKENLISDSLFFSSLIRFTDKNEYNIIINECYCDSEMFANIINYINRKNNADNILNLLLPYYNLFPLEKYDIYLELIDFLCMNNLKKILKRNLVNIIKNQHLFTAINIYHNDIENIINKLISNRLISNKLISDKYNKYLKKKT